MAVAWVEINMTGWLRVNNDCQDESKVVIMPYNFTIMSILKQALARDTQPGGRKAIV